MSTTNYRIKTGGRLLYLAENYRHRRKPAVVLETRAEKTTRVLFHLYAEHAPGELAITSKPFSLTESETDDFVVHWLLSRTPEQRAAVLARLPDGGLL